MATDALKRAIETHKAFQDAMAELSATLRAEQASEPPAVTIEQPTVKKGSNR